MPAQCPIGRETQQSPEWALQRNQSHEPVPSRVVPRGMENPWPWASGSLAMAQAKQCFTAPGEDRGVAIVKEASRPAALRQWLSTTP